MRRKIIPADKSKANIENKSEKDFRLKNEHRGDSDANEK